MANMLNIAVSGGLIVALIVLDKILSPRLVWARAEWFRILLVLAVIGFSFIGFTESFWDTGHGLWLLSLGLICGLLGYLYYSKASLGTLALAGFGVFILVAQFAFKLFEAADEGVVGIFFLQFIWMGGLTLGLVKAFRHFLTLPSSRLSIEASKADDDRIRFVNVIDGILWTNGTGRERSFQHISKRCRRQASLVYGAIFSCCRCCNRCAWRWFYSGAFSG